jgi:hypothetical protein
MVARHPGLPDNLTFAGECSLPSGSYIAFPPDPRRGRFLYEEVKRRIVESFREVAAASHSALLFNEVRFAALLDGAGRSERVSARLFGSYYDLLNAIDLDDLDAASEIFADLIDSGCECTALTYRNFTEQDLGKGNVARYKRLIDADSENPLYLSPITGAEFVRITRLADEALALLDSGAPEVSGEIRALLSEIIFATGELGAEAVFHGVSSFLLWGAISLNSHGHKTVLDVLQTLAHESSHMHLFGVAVDSPLVLNPDEERHASPLRRDARPMDGVYHATYVSARMHYALARLLESGILDATQRAQAEKDLREHVETFRKGLSTVEAHGRLTELGTALLSNAREYMAV